MNKQIKQWGEGLIKDWLNEEQAPGKKNLHNILSEPLLEELGDGFMVTMFRKPTKQTNQTNQTNQSNQNEMLQEHKSDFSDLEKKIIELLKAQPDVTTKEIMKKLEITDNQVKYYVKKLKDDGKIKRVGTNRKGSWKVM